MTLANTKAYMAFVPSTPKCDICIVHERLETLIKKFTFACAALSKKFHVWCVSFISTFWDGILRNNFHCKRLEIWWRIKLICVFEYCQPICQSGSMYWNNRVPKKKTSEFHRVPLFKKLHQVNVSLQNGLYSFLSSFSLKYYLPLRKQ